MAVLSDIQLVDLNTVALEKFGKQKYDLLSVVFSDVLCEAVADRISRGEQSLLFFNRRGDSHYVMCQDCSNIVLCKHCDISMTPHQKNGKYILSCHYCDAYFAYPDICTECKGTRLFSCGIGIQRVEEELIKRFPTANILRLDTDILRSKKSLLEYTKRLQTEHIDILLGTQVLAKGWDLPNVTFVGVLLADMSLYFPDFRASERTFQLITQVAGRSGRGQKKGTVLVQTFSPDHPALKAVIENNYQGFMESQLEERRQYQYPPFTKLCILRFSHKDSQIAHDTLYDISQRIEKHCSSDSYDVFDVHFRPGQPNRIAEKYIYEILMKGSDLQKILSLLSLSPEIIVDMDPLGF
jgi:primosomal protein N' (replication factor Y) (superfamily II helicase)